MCILTDRTIKIYIKRSLLTLSSRFLRGGRTFWLHEPRNKQRIIITLTIQNQYSESFDRSIHCGLTNNEIPVKTAKISVKTDLLFRFYRCFVLGLTCFLFSEGYRLFVNVLSTYHSELDRETCTTDCDRVTVH